ncbi:hypothetical protein [Terrimonas pollutisoli]|uniref:hypothetical protein n=1 Tax=Terrimonas pollutisoli TaxID=3034147 RepID=UPI0023ED80FB|nr:hypothetical protein [Terrimonas sp. H1YJ31]
MDAVFHIKAGEFDENFFNQLKSLLKSKKNLEITIAISEEQSKDILRKETKEEYFSRLNRAIDNLNKGKAISFTSKEFDD